MNDNSIKQILEFLDAINARYAMPVHLSSPVEIIDGFNEIVRSSYKDDIAIKCVLPLFFSLEDKNWTLSYSPIPFTIPNYFPQKVLTAAQYEDALTLHDECEKKPRLTKKLLDNANGTDLDVNFVLYSTAQNEGCSDIGCRAFLTNDGLHNVLRFCISEELCRTVRDWNNKFIESATSSQQFIGNNIHVYEQISVQIDRTTEKYWRLINEIAIPLFHHIPYLLEPGYSLYFIFAPAAATFDKAEITKLYSLGGLFVLLKGEQNGRTIFADCPQLEKEFIAKSRGIIGKLSSSLVTYFYRSITMVHATKSAIGSIMSRNGSHNIGSHVLAALSHNVGTMPDDRVLYQYIQHRMDYIATATTEFPTWRQPVLFVSSVMKQFMMQKHLLNFISRSEGLSAYQFQNSALTATTQPNTIRIHIRRVHNDVVDWEGRGAYSKSEYDNFVSYMAEDPHSLEKDVYVAIPGGIVGQHAFYTILENILRNAAKHEWATAHNKKDHLDLYVDFRDNPVSGKVEFQIWNDRASKADSKDEGDNKEDITKIVEKLEARMTCRFIDPDGQLRKENWGLAEMRISAGFLIGSDVSLIGGIGVDDKEMLSLIRPVTIKNCEGRDCLGYRFDLYKPKELLIVLPDEVTSGETPKFSEKTVEKLNALLAQYGINVISETKAKDSKGLAYSYVLFDKFNGKIQGTYNLPFRVLYTTEKRGMTNEREDACAIAKYKGSFKDVISGLEGLSSQGEGSAASAFAYKVLGLVYSSWVKHVIDQRHIPGTHELIVDMKDDGGGGKSLFANANLLHFVFENSFNSAVRSYLAAHTPSTLDPNLAGALYAMTKLSPRPQYTAKELSEEVDSDDDVENMILVQMVKWADLAKTDGRILKGYKTDDEDGLLLPLQDEWVAAGIWQTCFSAWNPRAGLELLLDGLLGNNSAACAEMGDFIAYIGGTILEQARAYLAKYEERHSTLPAWFGMSSEQQDEADVEWKVKHGDEEVFSQKIAFSSNCDKKETGKKSAFCYWRHGDDVARNNSRLPVDDRAIYLEPLSGSQSYLNAFKELNGALSVIQKHSKGKVLNEVEIAQRNNAIRFVTELVENSVMRVLIIDERMRKFADEHPDVASIFVSTGICILGGEEEIAAGLFKAYRAKNGKSTKKVFARKIDGIPIGKFEIVIIHQGIIDKQLEGLDKTTSIEDFYVWLKSNMRYVVITTGRGTPPNVPPGARVLPFSVVESTLFKRYPEKLLLVDTVMNMLPIGERSRS